MKNPPANVGDVGLIPGLEDPLEEEMATHSSILAWEIQGTEGPGGGYSPGVTEESDMPQHACTPPNHQQVLPNLLELKLQLRGELTHK